MLCNHYYSASLLFVVHSLSISVKIICENTRVFSSPFQKKILCCTYVHNRVLYINSSLTDHLPHALYHSQRPVRNIFQMRSSVANSPIHHPERVSEYISSGIINNACLRGG